MAAPFSGNMWQRLGEVAKSAHERAQVLAASVRDEAATLLQAIGTIHPGPVDEILYEEIDAYKAFCDKFQIDAHTDEISKILEEDDEIRGLHEEMVPVQLSYEEFWCRYFFRREEEEVRAREEEERKKRQQEEAAAQQQLLEDFDISDEGEDEEDNDEATEDTLEDGANAPPEDTEEAREAAREAARKLQREARTSRKAAKLWKQKAIEFQKQLGVLTAKHAEEKEDMQRLMESKLQSLSDSYENKITEATLQIDEARATGFDAGIQESEAIVASVKEQNDMEVAQLKSLLMEAEKHAASAASPNASGEAISSDMEQQLAEAKKEADLWKKRAIKMKHLKEELEKGASATSEQPSSEQPSNDSQDSTSIAKLKAENERLAKELADAKNKCTEIKDAAFAEGVSAGRAEQDVATAALKKEIDAMQSELQKLRAGNSAAVPSAGDVLAQADAVLSSVEADPLVLGADVAAESSAPAARDDWGEW